MPEGADGLIKTSPRFQGWGEPYTLETSIRAGAQERMAVSRKEKDCERQRGQDTCQERSPAPALHLTGQQ